YKGQREPKGTLVFDVELIDVPSHPPPDVKAPPADAKKTASGLSYKVLKDGVGGRHPRPTGSVTVNYTGWTTDGKMFDSSIVRGEPSTFQVDQVIPGWTEGLQLMYEGERTRFWIPENIAYKGKSAPYGMLVFDVELLKMQELEGVARAEGPGRVDRGPGWRALRRGRPACALPDLPRPARPDGRSGPAARVGGGGVADPANRALKAVGQRAP